MLTRFFARNYKGLQMAPLELGATGLFIGPNNCGKSNLFSAISFLFDLAGRPEDARGTLEAALRRRDGSAVLSRGEEEVGLEYGFEGGDIAYSITLGVGSGGDLVVRAETVRGHFELSTFGAWRDGRSVGWGWDYPLPGNHIVGNVESRPEFATHSMLEPSLEQYLERSEDQGRLPDLTIPLSQQIWLWTTAANSRAYRLSQLASSDIARPCKAGRATTLDDRGLELSNVLHHHLRDADFKRRLVDELSPLIPGLRDVRVYEGGGYRWIQLEDGRGWTDLATLSDGTTSLLVLATLLFSPVRGETLCLDEPELNLHPAWARVVAGWLVRRTAWRQVLVSTHSAEILDPLTDHVRDGSADLFVFQRSPRGYELDRCPPSRLEGALRDGWQLGDLYRIGEPALGGWPW